MVTTDVLPESMNTKEVHDSYVSLRKVERDFRAMKRKCGRSHARPRLLCCMLALKLSRENGAAAAAAFRNN